MNNLPTHISLTFIAITLITTFLFYLATNKNKKTLFVVLALAAAQGVLAYQGFFLATESIPPRLIFLLIPSVALILYAFNSEKGKAFMDQINSETYTYLHTVRIVVEIVILWLFLEQLMPESMTFEGRNFDVLSGLTAPFIAYFGFRKKTLGRKTLLAWNIICLLLVLQVVITGALSAPSVLQQIEFSQPNIAIFIFPFVWLPGIVVPIVIFGHLIAIRKFLIK